MSQGGGRNRPTTCAQLPTTKFLPKTASSLVVKALWLMNALIISGRVRALLSRLDRAGKFLEVSYNEVPVAEP